MMPECYQAIKQYKQRISDLQEELHQNYFNTDHLIKQVEQNEGEICSFINSNEQNRQYLLLASKIASRKISEHPLRPPKNVFVSKSHIFVDSQSRKIFYDQIITENSRLQLKIQPIKMHIFERMGKKRNGKNRLTEKLDFKLILFHIDRISQLGPFRYSKTTNLMKSYDRNYNMTSCKKKNKLGAFQMFYEITLSNFEAFKEIFTQENIVYIYFQNQFGLMSAVCTIDFWQLSTNMSNTNVQNGADLSFTKMLKFSPLGTSEECFSLECIITFNKRVISPELFELQERTHKERKIIKQSNRSRSPSPTLHKQTAKSLIKGTNRSKIQRITIYNNRQIKIPFYKKESRYEQMLKGYAIEQKENIIENRIEIIEESEKYFACLLVRTQNEWKQGYIEIKLGTIRLKVTIKVNSILQFVSLAQFKNVYKNQQNYRKHNIILKVTPNVYTRPTPTLKVFQYPIEQKTNLYEISSYFYKTSIYPEHFHIAGATLTSLAHSEKGVNIFFTLDAPEIRNNQLKLIFAGRSIYKSGDSEIDKLKTNKNKSKEEEKDVRKVKVEGQKKIIEKNHQVHIQLHVVKYIISELKPDINLSLDVKNVGIYILDMSGVLHKKSQFYLQSCNDAVLEVVRQRFDEETTKNGVQVQLLKPIKIQASVNLILHDLSRHMSTLINLQLNELEYWKHM